MFFQRVAAGEIARFDGEYYDPVALRADRSIRNGPHRNLGTLISTGYRTVYHGVDEVADEKGLPFLAPTDLDSEGCFDLSAIRVRVPEFYSRRYPIGIAESGELLIEVKGKTEKLAIVPKLDRGVCLMISGSLYKAKLISSADSHYVLSFLSSSYGNLLKRRVVSNINISYLGKSDLYDIPVPFPDSSIQVYIGNKVRQAETLRQRGRHLVKLSAKFFSSFHRRSAEDWRGSWRRRAEELQDGRLDAWFYAPAPTRLLDRLRSQGAKPLGRYVAPIRENLFDAAKPISYFEIGNLDVDTGCVWPMKVRAKNIPSRAQISIKPWDILVSTVRPERKNVGIVCPGHCGQLVASSGFSVLRAQTLEEATFVWCFLRSDAGTDQLLRWNTGGTYPAIDDSVPLEVLMPSFKKGDIRHQGATWARIPLLVRAARQLVTAARFLVEALIERKLTEDDLIAAHKDSSADRALLERLTVDGLDVPEADPLFPDLDELEVLLAEASKEDES